jgi:hypothetical protein
LLQHLDGFLVVRHVVTLVRYGSVSYGCKTWSVTLREEGVRELGVEEGYGATGGWRRLRV